MELDKCHLLFGCEIMKFFSTGLLLLIVFGSLEGSTIPHKRTVRALNATIQTHFNGTIQRTNPCTNKEVERSSYRGCHEFHHHSKESNWSEYSHKCATLISNFFQAISNLVTFKDRQSGTFDLNINTKVSHKTDGSCADTKKPICPTPTVIVESTDCEVLPSTSRDDLPGEDTHTQGSEICSSEEAVKVDEEEKEECPAGSEVSVNEEPQTQGSSSTYSGETIPTQEVNPLETKPEELQPETIPTYDNYPSSDQPSETTNIESSISNNYDDNSAPIVVKPDSTVPPSSEASSTVITSAPKVDLYIDVSETPQQSTGTDSETPSDSKDYASDYKSQTDEDKTEIPPPLSATQPEDSNDKVVPEDDDQAIEFSDKIALYNVREPQQESLQTLPPWTQNYYSDTTTPLTFGIKSDYDGQDIPMNTQPTTPPQYSSDSYDEPIQSSQAVTFAPVQPEPENYVNQYDQVASDLPTSSPPKDEGTLEFSDQLAVYNVRQPQVESPSSSSLLNEPTSIQPPALPESQSENYVNYEDGLLPNQLPTSIAPPQGDEPSIEFSDQLAVYNVRQPYSEPTSIQPPSSETQPANYVNYEDETVEKQSPTIPPVEEPSVEFSDQLAVYNVREPLPGTTTLSPIVETSNEPSLSQSDNYMNYETEVGSNQIPTTSSPQPEEYLEYSDQLAVYNVREPLPGTTTPYPLVESSIQPSSSQSDNYVNYETEVVPNQIPTTSSPQPEDNQYVEYSDQLAVYNVREPLPGTTTLSPIADTSIQPSSSQSDNYMNYETEVVPNQIPTTSSPQPEQEQYVEYSDQLAVYNVREPLPGTTTLSPIVETSVEPSSPQSDNYMNYETEVTPNQIPTTASPQPEQYVEYSDQLAVYNVREPLPTTTASSPAVDENIPSSLATTLSPSFPSYELDSYDSQKMEVEPQPTFAPMFEEVTSRPQPSTEPTSEFYGEYNEQTLSNQMSPFTTPAGNFYPTTMPSGEYIDNNGPEPPSSDYSSSQDIGGFVSTSLPPSSDYTSSFNNIELQYDSQPASTMLPSEAQQNQVFSDQVSDIREPQSDSSVSDGPIYDMVTAISPVTESESSIPYDDGSVTDSQQIIPSESQQETSITNEYPAPSLPNQSSPNNYEIYDEQSSTSENEAPMTSINEPITYQQSPTDVITTPPLPTESENFGIYDDSKFPAEPQGTYPPKIENQSFANYDDNDTSTAGQASVSIEPLSANDSSENESMSSEEGSSSQEEDGNVTVSDDQGLLPLSSNTFRPTVQIETTVNYADQTPFRPIGLPSSIGPLQENNIIYDEGVFRNETEPSAVGGEEETVNSLNVSSELTKQNEGKEFESSTTLAPELEIDTYYEETFKQPTSSDAPKINNYVNYEDDVQSSSPKFDLNTTVSNDYSTSFLPSTPSLLQEIITTPSTSEAMPETNNDYEYSKTDFNSQTTFPPQTESVNYDDHSSQDQSSTQQQQSVDYAAYDNQIQSTASPNPADQEMIEFSDQLSIYNVPEAALESSPVLSELFSSNIVTTTQPTTSSDGNNLEMELQPTFSPSIEPQNYDEQRYTEPLPSKDLNLDTYVNYEDTASSSQLPTTPSPPNEVDPSLEYSDQLAVYNVRQPQVESPSSSSLLNEPTSIQPPALPESHSENYVNYEDGLLPNQLSTSISPPKGDEPSIEFSDQLAVYNVRQPYSEPTSIQPTSSESQTDNYEYQTESNEPTTSSSPSVNVEPSVEFADQVPIYDDQPQSQFSSPSPQLGENIPRITISTLPPTSVFDPPISTQPTSPEAEQESEEDYEDEMVSTTLSSPKEEPSVEFSDELAIYNVRQPSTASPVSSINYVESSSQSQPENYVSYDDEKLSTQTPTTASPLSSVSYVEPSSSQPSVVPESQPEPMSYDYERLPNQIPTTASPQPEQYVEYSDQLAVYNVREPLPGTTTSSPLVETSIEPSSPQSDNYMNYETEVVPNQIPTTSSPQPEQEQYVEYSDQLAVYNVREPLPSTTTSSPDIIENIPSSFATTLPPLFSSNRIETYDEQTVGSELQPTVASEMYDEPTSAPATSFSPTETENYVNYEGGEFPTTLSPPKSVEPFVEYSDELSIYNIRQPEYYSSSPPTVNENLVTTTGPNLPFDDFGTNDNPVEVPDSQPTLAPGSESQVYDEPTSSAGASAPQSDVYTNYDDTVVSNEFQTSPSPVEPSVEITSQLDSSSIAPSSSSSVEEAPFLQYSDQLSIYNVRQPSFETTAPPSPSEIEDASSGAMPVSTIEPFPSRDSFQAYDPRVTSSDYVSAPPSQLIPESQVTYEDYTAQREESPSTLSTINLAPSQDFSVPPSNYSAEQEFDYQPTSPPQSQDNYVAYEDQTVSNALTTPSPLREVEPFLEYSDQLAVYNVREPVFVSTVPPVFSENIPSSITTLSPSSPQPSSSEPQSDTYEEYEDETVANEPSTTLSSPAQTGVPSVEYSDQLSAFNVLGPAIVPISAPVVEENVLSGDVTTSLPLSLNDEPTSPQTTSSESQSDSDEDYEEETVSTPSPVTSVEPFVEVSDELSIYNVRKRPSQMFTPSPLSESIPSEAVTTFAPYIPSDKFESYDYQPSGFESQPTFSPESESPKYNQPISVPTSSQPQDNYVNYENEIESKEPMTTLRPPVDVEYSDELAIYNVRSPFTPSSTPSPLLNENIAVDTVSTFMPAPVYDEPTSAPSTSPEEQPDNFINYEDQLASNKFPITYPPSKEEPTMISSDQLSINTTSAQSLPSDGFNYDSQVEYSDSQTTVPTELTPQMNNQPITVQPLTSSESQPEQYVNYEDEGISTPPPTSTSGNQVEPSIEFSDQLAAYNVREPLPGTTTSSPIVESSIEPSSSQSDNYMNYETEVGSNQVPTTSSPQPEQEQYVEYSDQLAVYNVREPLPGTTTPYPLVESSIQPSSSQSDNYVNYETEVVPNQIPTTASPQPEDNQYVEYSDQLAVYNVREPLPGTTTSSPIVETSIEPSSPQSDNYMNYETEVVPNQIPTTSSPQPEDSQYVEYSDQLAVYNVREPLPTTTASYPVVSENVLGSVVSTLSPSSSLSVEPVSIQPSSSESQSDGDDYYEDESNESSTTLSTPVRVEPSVEVSDELAIYNVRQPGYSSTSPSPLSENISSDFQPTTSPQSDSEIYDEPTSIPASSSESKTDEYLNYEDKTVANQLSSSLSPPSQVEPSLEYSDQLAVYNVRQPEYSSSPSPMNEMVTTAAPSPLPDGFGTYDSQVLYTDFQPTSSPQSDSQIYDEPTSSSPVSESKPDSYVNYEDQIVPNQASSSLSPPVQVEPSVEYSDQLAVYNVREPVFEPTSPPVVSENVLSSVVTTLPPSSLVVEQTSPQSSSSESQSDSDEDYEEETVSTPSPVAGVGPSVEVSDELSIYNVRQRPSQMSTPSPFNNNVINSLMTTISPYFTFKESSSQDSLNTISQTTVSPEYVSDMYDEESSIQPSKTNEDDSQALSDETTPKDSLPETLNNFAEQTIPNVIQSTQSPDLSNQLFSENEVELQKASFITVEPGVESSVISNPSFESSPGQEFDYQPTFSPEYETPEETMTTPSSSRQSQDVVYEDQTVSNELTTSSPVNEVEPSLEYPNQLTVDNTLLSETSTSPQSQIVNYDYYNDQNQKPEEPSALPPSTEIDTDITLTEVGPTFPPNFESQIFDKSDSIQHTTSEIQPNYVDYEDSVVSNQTPTSPSPQTEVQPAIEFSDQLAVYNVRQPYFEPTSIQPSSSPSEPQPDNYDTYEDQVIVSEQSTPQKVESTVTQPTSTPEGETQMYEEPNLPSATSSEPQPEQYVNYEDERISTPSPTSTSGNQVEPSVEFSDELAVYNVREPLPGTTTPYPLVESSIQPSSSQSDNYVNYETEVVPNQIPTTSSPQPEDNQYVEYSDQLAVYNVREPLPGTTTSSPIVETSIEPSSPQSDNYMNYETEDVPNQIPTTSSPQPEQYVEYSDQLAVYNVREPLPTTTASYPVVESSTQPSSPVVSENVLGSVVTTLSPFSPLRVEPISAQTISPETEQESEEDYEDEMVSTTLSSPKEEPSVEFSDELAIYNVRQPSTASPLPSVSYVEPSSLQPSVVPESQPEPMSYDYERLPNQIPTTASPQPEQYVEYSDQLAVYNVREPLPGTTTSSPIVETFEPSSSQSDNYMNYETEVVPNQLPTTASPQAQENQYVEYSDQLAVYNVREPVFEPTSPPVVSENVLSSVVTTLRPSSLVVEQTSPQSSSPESQSDSDEDYEDETVSTPSPVTSVEPFVEVSDELSIYNVRQRPSEMSTPSPFNNNVINTLITTISPFFTSSSNDNEGSTFQSSVTSEPEPELYDQPYSASSPSSDSTSNNYVNSEDEITTNEYSTSSRPPTEQLSIYNVHQRPSDLSSSSLLIENLSDNVVTTAAPSFSSNVFDTHEQNDEPNFSPEVEPKSYDDSGFIQNSTPVSQPENYVSYDDETVSNGLSTSSPPTTGGQPSIEFSDELAIYNVRQPSTASPLPSVSYVESSSPQPSVVPEPQPDNYVTYDDEKLSNEIPTTASPQPEDNQYVEYSDQLAVYNVREPLPGTTTLSPIVEPSIEPSSSQSDNYMNYETEVGLNLIPTTSSPQPEQYVEYSDQLAVYNVREPLPGTTTSSPVVENFIQPSSPVVSENVLGNVISTLSPSFPLSVEPISIQPSSSESQSDGDDDYEDESNEFSTTLSTPVRVEPSVEVSDELAIYNVRQPSTASPLSSVSYVEPSSPQPSVVPESQPDNYVSYDDEQLPNQIPITSSPQPEQYVEYSDQLAVYNVREPLPGTTTSSPIAETSIEPSSPQSDNYMNYESEDVPNQLPTTSSPQPEDSQYVEYSDQLAVYNVREPLPGTTTSSPIIETSIQPSSQSDINENYEDEVITQQPSTSSPKLGEDQYVEYSDELAVYNVREPLPSTTASSPAVDFSSSIVTTPSPFFESDKLLNQDYGIVPTESQSTSAPQYDETYDETKTTQSSFDSQPDSYKDYEGQFLATISPSQDIKVPISNSIVPTAAPPLPSMEYDTYDRQVEYTDSQTIVPTELTPQMSNEPTTIRPFTSSEPQPEQYVNYEDEGISTPLPTSTSGIQVEPSVEFSDELAVYNVREPLPGTTTPYPLVESSIQPSSSQSDNYINYETEVGLNQIPTTSSPQPEDNQYVEYSDQLAVYNVREPLPGTTTSSPIVETSIEPSSSQSDNYMNYETEVVPNQTPTTSSPQPEQEQYVEYSDQLAVYNVREPLPTTTASYPVVSENVLGSVVSTLSPSSSLSVEPISIQPSSSESQSDGDDYYEDESNESSTTLSTPGHVEPSVEFSDDLAIYNVREPLVEPTPPPTITENIANSVVTPPSLSVQPISSIPPTSSNLQSVSYGYEDYKDETVSKEPPTTLSSPVQVEPSIEYSDQLAVYNVREPLLEPTSSPIISEYIPGSVVTTLSPSSSEPQSDGDDDYENESNESPTTPSTPIQVEPSVEYSDQLAIYNVRQPSPSPLTENFANDIVTTAAPSFATGDFETYDNQVVYTDFQPTFSPPSDSQMYDEPTSIPASSPDNYVNYEDKMVSNVAVTSASPPVDVDIEYSDELAIYNVRQPSTLPPLMSDIATIPPSFVPKSDSNVFPTLSPFTQNSVQSEQDDFYTYDDQNQSSNPQTTFSPETEYDEAPTSPKPQSPSVQPLLETMVTTFQPLTESQKNKTNTPSKQQQVSTFPPLYPFVPLNQPPYSVESKLVSEQQNQLISNQVVNSPLVPPSELDSDKRSNNLSNLVRSQEPRPIDGVENTQRDTPQPEPLALVPDQSNPSNEPGEEYVSCTCTRGNGRAAQHTLMCPFNPVLKGNMTAPSYYILISKLSGDSGNQSLPDEERFQVEKVYLGDGTPLNCTEERKSFPTSKYTPVPISSSRTVKLPIRLNNA